MAERRPIVLIDGDLRELPSGDTLPGSGGGGTTLPTIQPGDAGKAVLINPGEDGYIYGDAGGSASYPAFTNNAGKILAVNQAEDGVEWIDAPSGSGGASGNALQGFFVWGSSSGAGTVANWSNEVLDTENAFDPVTGIFTVPAAWDGKYMILTANVRASTSGSIYIQKDTAGDNTFLNWAVEGVSSNHGAASVIMPVASGDQIKLNTFGFTVSDETRTNFSGFLFNPSVDGSGGGGSPDGYRYFRWTFSTSGLFTIGNIVPTGLDISSATRIDSDPFYGPEANAFDGDTATFWGHNVGFAKDAQWVGFDLGADNYGWFTSFDIVSRSSSGSQANTMTTMWLQGSNDGVVWNDIQEYDTSGDSFGNSETKNYTITATQPGDLVLAKPAPAQDGKALVASNDGTADWTGDVLPAVTISDSQKYLKVKADGTGYELVDEAAAKFSRWRWTFTEAGSYAGGAMGEITAYDDKGTILNRGGTASAYDETYGDVDNLFNGSGSDWAGAGNIGVVDVWVQYDFTVPVWITTYNMEPRNSSNASQSSRGWTLEYYDFDLDDWVLADTVTGEASWTSGEVGTGRDFTVDLAQPAATGPFPTLTGNTGKILAVNGAEDDVEWIDAPSGGGGSGALTEVIISDAMSDTGAYGGTSATAAATKGNRVRSQFDVDLKDVIFRANEATSETYEATVVEINGAVLGTVIGRASAVSTGGSAEDVTINFSTPVRMVTDQDYVILITQKGGTASTVLDSSSGANGLVGVVSSYALGGYIADDDIQGGETFVSFGSSYVGMQLRYDIVMEANGTGLYNPVIGINEAYDTGGSASSASAYAFKGNFLDIIKDTALYQIDFVADASQSVKAAIYKVTQAGGNETDGTVSEVLYTSDTFTTVAGVNTIVLPQAISLQAGEVIVAGLHHQTSDTTALGVPFNSGNPAAGNQVGFQTAARLAQSTPWAVSETITPYTATDDAVGMVVHTMPYNTFTTFKGEKGDAGGSMVQTEVVSTAYSTQEADFAGDVVRRMNNASAITVTVEPSMTNQQPCTFIQTGAGTVTFAQGTGVTIQSLSGNLDIAGQYGSATLIPDVDTANLYYLVGALA